MQPAPKSHKTIVILVVALAFSGFCLCMCPIVAAVMVPAMAHARERARHGACLTNLRQIGQASQMYLQDYEERFPPANRWGDGLRPYVRDDAVFRCPSVPVRDFGYAMNSELSRRAMAKISAPETVPLVYDSSNLAWNAHDPLQSLPYPPRHSSFGNNILFADGAARPQQLPPP
ncbi:MAG: hypothetical protein ACK4UU_09265 [Fimbriimonadales bacterium]